MTKDDLSAILTKRFGESVSLRARRPSLYQVSLPAYLGDGDGATVFVEQLDNDHVRMTDLGHTLMRLSYTRKIDETCSRAVERLAHLHGFTLLDGAITCDVAKDEILAGILGLVQIEAEAEASIVVATTRLQRSEKFRAEVKKVLTTLFGSKCVLDYHTEDDPDGLYSIDAKIEGRTQAFVAVASVDLDAERAVQAKLHMMKVGPGLAKASHWVAVPRDLEKFSSRTRMRLSKEFISPIPKYDEAPDRLGAELKKLTN